jgi:F-type H+-transporting ATPase subunit c
MMEFLPMLGQAAEAAAAATKNMGIAQYAMAVAGGGAALGIGFIGGKAAEATGRNPGAAGPILTISVLGMALAEAIAIYALVLAFVQG